MGISNDKAGELIDLVNTVLERLPTLNFSDLCTPTDGFRIEYARLTPARRCPPKSELISNFEYGDDYCVIRIDAQRVPPIDPRLPYTTIPIFLHLKEVELCDDLYDLVKHKVDMAQREMVEFMRREAD